MSGHSRSFLIPEWAAAMLRSCFTMDGPVAAPLYPPLLPAEQWRKAIADGLEEVFHNDGCRFQHVVIMVEDTSRPSDTAPIIQFMAEHLRRFLPRDATLDLLVAGGAHDGLEKENARKVPPNFPGHIRTHDCRNAQFAGEVDGVPLLLDRAVLAADLRIAVGTVNLHPKVGFSGGAKILVPGCAGLPTIFALHNLAEGSSGEFETPIRRFADHVLKQFPMDFSVQLLTDQTGRILQVFTGELGQAWRDAAETLLSWVSLPLSHLFPFCIADAEPFDQNLLGIFKALPSIIQATEPTGSACIITRSPQGVGEHRWRLDTEIISRERRRWEEQLGERKIYILTEAQIVEDLWKTIFPPQILPYNGNLQMLPITDCLTIRSAPLIRFPP